MAKWNNAPAIENEFPCKDCDMRGECEKPCAEYIKHATSKTVEASRSKKVKQNAYVNVTDKGDTMKGGNWDN